MTDEEYAALPPIINLRDYGLSWDWLISKTTFRAAIESGDYTMKETTAALNRTMHDLTDEEKASA